MFQDVINIIQLLYFNWEVFKNNARTPASIEQNNKDYNYINNIIEAIEEEKE